MFDVNFTVIIIFAAVVLVAFLLGRCNGYNGSDEERIKLIERARNEDSLRAIETQKAIQADREDSIEAKRLVDSAKSAEDKADAESNTYLEHERLNNQKIKDEISNPNNTDVERIARIRIILAKQRQLKQRQSEAIDTANR